MISQKQPLEVFCKKVVPINFAKFTGKNLRQKLLFNKVAGWSHLRSPNPLEGGMISWMWCYNIDPAHQTNIMSSLNCFTALRGGCWNDTTWPWVMRVLRFCKAGTTMVKRRNTNVEKTLWLWSCGYNVVLAFPLQYSRYAWCIYYPTLRQRWYNFFNVTWWYQCREDVVNLTSHAHRLSNVVSATFIVQRGLNLLSNVETTLEQRCNFDVVASTSLQRCLLVKRCCDLITILSQRCVFAGYFPHFLYCVVLLLA